jgi:DNA-binding transcriptional LysR family regulator
METLANLEPFVQAAEGRSFSHAGRKPGLTAAAISRNVAMLERNLGVRLFQRTTRKLTLTEAGERFLVAIEGNLDALQVAIAEAAAQMREAARLGLGISLIALFDVLPELERGDLIRLLPDWYADAGAISIYYASRKLISAKTRVFVDCVVNGFKSKRFPTPQSQAGR